MSLAQVLTTAHLHQTTMSATPHRTHQSHMPLTRCICRCASRISFGLSETTDWSCFSDGDGDDCSSNEDSPSSLDQEYPSNHEPVLQLPPQFQVILKDLAHSEATISQIRDYFFNHEKSQWSEDKLDSFFNPLQETWTLDDPQLLLSFQIYLSLLPIPLMSQPMKRFAQVSKGATLQAPCFHLTRSEID
jgi:hypothetical protein